MKNLIIKISVLIPVFFLIAVPAMAQGAPPATPIDGGLSLLLIAGGAYGAKKIYEKRK
ncbi:MAG: hypothetical protein RIA69_05315 [Cyclobacteriaceae bacterium]